MKDLGNKHIMSKNLKRLMADRNISAKELSRILDFPYTTVLSWLKASNYPRIDKIEAMADYFGILKSDLIEERIPEEQEKPADEDELTESQIELIDFARTLSEEQAEKFLQIMKSILAFDE
jgi:transcriptional regulator with XRE-family HTH domain